YQPLSAIVTRVKPGVPIRAGDMIWAYEAPEATQFVAVSATGSRISTSTWVHPAPGPKSAASAAAASAAPTPSEPIAPSSDTPASHIVPSQIKRPAGSGSLSRSGASGLIRMPSAAITPDGELQLARFGVHSRIDPRTVGSTAASAVSVGFLPHLEIGATLGSETQRRDISINAKWQFLKESSRYPALAVGAAELKKTGRAGENDLFYAVGSKSLLRGRVNVTAGVQRTDVRGTDPYGGLEIGIMRSLSAIIEHDGIDNNYGVRASFFRNRLVVGAEHVNERWALYSGIRVPLSLRSKPPGAVDLPSYGNQAGGVAAAAQAAQKRLINLGLENVAVRVLGPSGGTAAITTPQRMEIAYENRSFPLDEMDALANVLATAAVYAPEGVTELAVIIKRTAIPVLYVACPLQDYRRFMAGQISAKDFATRFQVDNVKREASALSVVASTGRGASSYGHADIVLNPRLSAQVGTELYQVGIGLDLAPELNLPLARGINVAGRAIFAGVGPLRATEDVDYDRLALEMSTKLGPILARGYIGRFPAGTFVASEPRHDAVFAEATWIPKAGRFTARGGIGAVKRQDVSTAPNERENTYLGEVRYYVPDLEFSLRAVGGRFTDGDTGYKLTALRQFGDTEFGLEYRDTSGGLAGTFFASSGKRSRVAVARFSIPIGPSYVPWKPSIVRLRPPDFLDYNLRSLLTRPNFLVPAAVTANELAVTDDTRRTLLDRDQLRRPHLLHSLPALRKIRHIESGPGGAATGAAPEAAPEAATGADK
ncbi:MAG: YjbH domain-containing protein, partial [Armatimonadota bacterium]|nr:YjbH domain-containing protein [Armatimonadota bacterium]